MTHLNQIQQCSWDAIFYERNTLIVLTLNKDNFFYELLAAEGLREVKRTPDVSSLSVCVENTQQK